MEANSGSYEAIKHKLQQKIKALSDEAFNAGKEIKVMKSLTLHRIPSSLHRFIASSLLLPSFAYRVLSPPCCSLGTYLAATMLLPRNTCCHLASHLYCIWLPPCCCLGTCRHLASLATVSSRYHMAA
jgi:hypothetical protein